MRRYDVAPHELEAGDYCQRVIKIDGKRIEAWFVCTPNGLLGRLSHPDESGRTSTSAHHVVEHEDGEISVQPQPNNSNSILVTYLAGDETKSWHGYIDHGVWREC